MRKIKIFFDFDIDPGIVKRSTKFIIFGSDNDHPDVQESVNLLKEKLPNIVFKNFHNYGHFCYRDLKSEKFPELLGAVLN